MAHFCFEFSRFCIRLKIRPFVLDIKRKSPRKLKVDGDGESFDDDIHIGIEMGERMAIFLLFAIIIVYVVL
jgi:hypothetical protein